MASPQVPSDPDDPLLRALAEHWDEVLALADEEQRSRLIALVDGTAEPDPVDARALIADELLMLLPPRHPLVDVLRTGVLFDPGGGASEEVTLTAALRWLRSRVLAGAPGDELPDPETQPGLAAGIPEPRPDVRPDLAFAAPAPDPGLPPGPVVESDPWDWFDQEVRDRLLSLPALSLAEVRARGADPADDGLIRLTHPDYGQQFPRFQFQLPAPGAPWPVVTRVNRLLDAENDPWGVTCWWVDPHARLDTVPADLLGTGQDELLLWAAAEIGAD